jgi:hypothetical protein
MGAESGGNRCGKGGSVFGEKTGFEPGCGKIERERYNHDYRH